MNPDAERPLAPVRYASRTTARLYDSQLRLEHAALSAAIALAAPKAAELVLDIGTGTAGLLRLLAAQPDRPARAIGVDASAAMLARSPGLPVNWRLLRADARRLPFADASIDVVTCAYLLHLLDEPGRREVLEEVARVLRPEGRAVLVTLLEPRGVIGRWLLAPAQRTLCRVLGPGSGWCALDPSPALCDSGLQLVRGRISTRGYASLCLRLERA